MATPPLRPGIDFAALARMQPARKLTYPDNYLNPLPPSQVMTAAPAVKVESPAYQQGVSRAAYQQALAGTGGTGDKTFDALLRQRLAGNQGTSEQYLSTIPGAAQSRVNAIAQSGGGLLRQKQDDYAFADQYKKALIDQQNARQAYALAHPAAGGGGGGGRRGGGGGGRRRRSSGGGGGSTTYSTPPVQTGPSQTDVFLSLLDAILAPTAAPGPRKPTPTPQPRSDARFGPR